MFTFEYIQKINELDASHIYGLTEDWPRKESIVSYS
jgi:hypothetical protein